ncbi:hypothetical protein KDA_73900 [Dictyobacter alpinus]|uniref:Uncharacterized protein n=2 Tax=Dictyobacter alpinus TaxID=2014873 RepID=A0A402BKR0_9CHLR|nr:hypothetical protein KDA_73900 [Dictyobacter alpinus]
MLIIYIYNNFFYNLYGQPLQALQNMLHPYLASFPLVGLYVLLGTIGTFFLGRLGSKLGSRYRRPQPKEERPDLATHSIDR